jgi:hypothetical protein
MGAKKAAPGAGALPPQAAPGGAGGFKLDAAKPRAQFTEPKHDRSAKANLKTSPGGSKTSAAASRIVRPRGVR